MYLWIAKQPKFVRHNVLQQQNVMTIVKWRHKTMFELQTVTAWGAYHAPPLGFSRITPEP